MKKLLLVICIALLGTKAQAQDFNQWSVEFGFGVHEAIYPLSPGYETGSPAFGQANLGLRYMFNERFGLRLGFGYHEFSDGGDSNPFKANYYRTSLEAVVNAGNLLKFGSWTNKFNLLMHGGAGYSTLNTIQPIDNGGDPMLHFIIGFTPQYKLSNRISLFADVSTIFHHFQSTTFDGAPHPSPRETNVGIFNASLGLNVSLGNSRKQHADFYRPVVEKNEMVDKELEAIKKRLDSAEQEIAKLKNKTAAPNQELILTELDERYVKKDEINKYADVVTNSNVDFIRKLLESGYVNVYFDTNKTRIQDGSLNAVNYLKQFMKDNPTVTAVLIGYADETGTPARNKTLSVNRAKSVQKILVASGIDPTRLTYVGAGEDTSVGKEAHQFARRVTFQINK